MMGPDLKTDDERVYVFDRWAESSHGARLQHLKNSDPSGEFCYIADESVHNLDSTCCCLLRESKPDLMAESQGLDKFRGENKSV